MKSVNKLQGKPKESEKPKDSGKVTITKVFDFAGEEVRWVGSSEASAAGSVQSTCCPAADRLMHVKQGVCSCLFLYTFNHEHRKTSRKMRPGFLPRAAEYPYMQTTAFDHLQNIPVNSLRLPQLDNVWNDGTARAEARRELNITTQRLQSRILFFQCSPNCVLVAGYLLAISQLTFTVLYRGVQDSCKRCFTGLMVNHFLL